MISMLLPTICALLLAAAQAPADGRTLRAALRTSERTIDERVQQMTARAPFALLGTTRGAYLAGYGVVFTVEVNLVPVGGLSPFRPAYTPQEIQAINKQKREKLAVLKAGLRQLLVDQAAALSLVPPAEKVAIGVTLFNYNWENTDGLPSQLVMQATRQALLDLHGHHAAPDAQERAVEVKEF